MKLQEDAHPRNEPFNEVEERAAWWLIERDDPNFSDAQRAQMQAWLDQRPQHREVYEALERTWERMTLVLRAAPACRCGHRMLQHIAQFCDLCPCENYRAG